MERTDLFGNSEDKNDVQGGLGLDDLGGLRVVDAKFLNEHQFSWDLFSGFDSLKVLTYSASVNAIVRMLDKYSYNKFECVFGYEGVLRDIKDVLSFQKVVIGSTRAAIMGLKDERHIHILEKVNSGEARFYVLRKYIAHAKLYLRWSPKTGQVVKIEFCY